MMNMYTFQFCLISEKFPESTHISQSPDKDWNFPGKNH